jgi:CRP-like cAMP-binding protein
MNPLQHPTREALLPLLQVFHSLHPLGKGVEQFLLKNAYCCRLAKGKYLVRHGAVCDSVYFIKKGLLRGFIEEDNKEITTWFALENELVAAISTFVQHPPARENIQAVEDCELIGMKLADLDTLYLRYPSFNTIGRKVMELYYGLAESRAYITRLHDAERKYELFLLHFSHFANRVQLTHIASFLGMTIETLSRVRAKATSRKSN